MINGFVTVDGVPMIRIPTGDREWPAIVDTGFNGGLELPLACRRAVAPRFVGRMVSNLAGGQSVEEDNYRVTFIFDGKQLVWNDRLHVLYRRTGSPLHGVFS